MENVYPICLLGEQAVLLPLEAVHTDALFASGNDPLLWRFSAMRVASLPDMEDLVETFLREQQTGTAIPFVISERSSQHVIGSTQIHSIVPAHGQVEIGKTWLARAHWNTGMNTECKYLLLTYCFETLQCLRVQFRVDGRNVRSQQALERLGARWEGCLRHNAILPDGYVRDTVYYSILREEWFTCKTNILQRLQKQKSRRQ